jgi:hypothetical protein
LKLKKSLNQIKPQRLRGEEQSQRKKIKYKLLHYGPSPLFKVLGEKCLSKEKRTWRKTMINQKKRKRKCVYIEVVRLFLEGYCKKCLAKIKLEAQKR